MRGQIVLACLMAVGLGGCFSIKLDPDPYAFDVPGRQLREVPSHAMLSAPVPATVVADARVEAGPAEPVRSDVRGAGDGSTTLDRVIVRGAKEIEHRVPDFSREQVAAFACRARYNEGRGLPVAVDAWRATVAAHDARTAYAAGKLSAKLADEAEKKRQEAVGTFHNGSNFLFGLFGGRSKKEHLPKPVAGGLALESIDLFTFIENGLEVMAVSGRVRNTGKTRETVPPVTLQALDRWEFILAGQTRLLPAEALAPGESAAFEIRFINPPDTTFEVYAHFAPPFEYRAARDCENFDPLQAKPLKATAAVKSDGPVQTASELNELVRIYRVQAEDAWTCRLGKHSKPVDGGLRFAADGSGERRGPFSISLGAPDMARMCAGVEQMMGWRDLFVMAEAADEAWGASRAVEDARQRSGEVAAAEAAQRLAMDRVAHVATLALARAGGSAPGVTVELTRSAFGYDNGKYIEIAGVLRNTTDAARDVDALMLAMVDRLDLPLMTMAVENPVRLAPGESAPFVHRAALREEPTKRRNDGATPPTWQIRVGAMDR